MLERLKTDILILGSGGAGLFAALHAHQANPDLKVTVATKGLLGKCGCTRMVQGGYNVALNPGDSIERHGGAYLAVIGGAAALETTWIEQIEDVDLDDLNPESLWKFRIRDFGPLLVAMDSHGESLYAKVKDAAQQRRAEALRLLGVKHSDRGVR